MSRWGGRKVAALRPVVIALHGSTCWRCRTAIDLSLSATHPDGFTIGHVLPRSLGGSDRIENLRPEHRRCNVSAGNRLGSVRPPRRHQRNPSVF